MDIPIAGLQKNDKHQTHELLFGDPLEVVELSRNSQEFFLLQRIQDEVHRFAITFHRQLRSKNPFSSQLDGIEGLGPKRKQNLMKHFKSLAKIKESVNTGFWEIFFFLVQVQMILVKDLKCFMRFCLRLGPRPSIPSSCDEKEFLERN